MKIRGKMLSAFGVVVIVILFSGIVGNLQIERLYTSSRNVTLVTIPHARVMQDYALNVTTAHLADGDFSDTVTLKSSDEIGMIGESMNNVSHSLHSIISEVQTVTGNLSDTSLELSAIWIKLQPW